MVEWLPYLVGGFLLVYGLGMYFWGLSRGRRR